MELHTPLDLRPLCTAQKYPEDTEMMKKTIVEYFNKFNDGHKISSNTFVGIVFPGHTPSSIENQKEDIYINDYQELEIAPKQNVSGSMKAGCWE